MSIFSYKKIGTKINNIKNNPNVSLFILGNQKIITDRYITHYESVIVTGKATIVSDEDKIKEKLILLCEKIAPTETKRSNRKIYKSCMYS